MNIILVPGNSGSGKNSCLSHRHLLLIVLVGALFLPVFLGIITFRIQELLSRHGASDDRVALYAKELAAQARAVEKAKEEAATHLNALARRMGQLQAQVLRLNALGGRLSHMAGLDAREFNFDTEVAQGGPENGTASGVMEVTGSLTRLTEEIKGSEARLRALETLLLDRRLTDAVTPAGWPADGGFISSGFGHRADPFTGQVAYHEGVDIASRLGSRIKAMADGVVSFAGEKAQYGRTVEITHGRGITTRYAHTHSLLVKVGDKVNRGDAIALVGSSGRSTGPHVHVEVLRDGRSVNPSVYLRPSSHALAKK
jgi:murein DD-endopeptidase MepM/ murein hydrolase activator NlpD